MSLTAALRAEADPVWRAQLDHPFVRGIGDGTLSLDRFTHWVRQDYLFLIEYCRLFGLAAARAPDLATLVRFGKPYVELLDVAREMDADLIVLGVQGRGALDMGFFGSTANQVVRRATCPVLTVRSLATQS